MLSSWINSRTFKWLRMLQGQSKKKGEFLGRRRMKSRITLSLIPLMQLARFRNPKVLWWLRKWMEENPIHQSKITPLPGITTIAHSRPVRFPWRARKVSPQNVNASMAQLKKSTDTMPLRCPWATAIFPMLTICTFKTTDLKTSLWNLI